MRSCCPSLALREVLSSRPRWPAARRDAGTHFSITCDFATDIAATGHTPSADCGVTSKGLILDHGAKNSHRRKIREHQEKSRDPVRHLPLYGVELHLVDVAPAPLVTRLGGFHDGVAGGVEVFRRMLILRRVATA